MWVWVDSLYPEIRADIASDTNARNPILMAASEDSVNMLSAPSLILFVKGTAEDTNR
jgi:hypothetical protein